MINKITNVLFHAKFSFARPKKKEILIFDKNGSETILKAVKFPKKIFGICENRKKEINIHVMIKTLLNLKLNYKNYLINYIKMFNPKIVITFIDNELFFYKLKKEFPKIKFYSIQNGVRFLNDEMLKTLYKTKNSKKKYSSDKYFVFNDNVKRLMENYIDTKCFVLGSIKNNLDNLKNKKVKKEHVGFISRFRSITLSAISNQIKDDPNYIVHKFSSELLVNVAKYCMEKKIKLSIITSTDSKLLLAEKKYYKDILKNYNFNFIKKKHGYDSYSYINQFTLLVSPSSTLGIEALGKKIKVIYFSEKKILGSNFGWPFLKVKNGPFFSNYYTYKYVNKIMNKIRKFDDNEWYTILNKYKKYICNYDYQNIVLNREIQKDLKIIK